MSDRYDDDMRELRRENTLLRRDLEIAMKDMARVQAANEVLKSRPTVLTQHPLGYVMSRVGVLLVLTDEPGEEAEQIFLEFEGSPTQLQALGMLRMAENVLLTGAES